MTAMSRSVNNQACFLVFKTAHLAISPFIYSCTLAALVFIAIVFIERYFVPFIHTIVVVFLFVKETLNVRLFYFGSVASQ